MDNATSSTTSAPGVTFKDLQTAAEVIKKSKYVTRTPLIRVDPQRFGISEEMELYFKLEGMQNAGSFKIRGVINQLENAPEEAIDGRRQLITMSAGNFGRSFAYMCREFKLRAKVLMPITAPQDRADLIRSYGVEVDMVPTSELQVIVDKYVAEQGMIFMHPFDDPHLIAGHGSMGMEILEDLTSVDIVLVCCGGGGLLAGTAAAFKLSGKGEGTRIIGVEPEGACTMYQSMKEGRPVTKGDVKSVASGLAPPYAGKNTYSIIREYVEAIALVSEEEIKEGVRILYENGLVVEPSGAAAFSALRFGKISGASGMRVVLTISGSNITPQKLADLLNK